ncbi:polysaccharide deacetylase family protein [Fodinibius salsisoli]|uniref:Polysaccharide deacetylase family protein n=1 Tax=Fodinibius salsisoli TaxID=2820877 RepID=A0ABT3PTD7_9BACT|nr:polysaccharide deacetylase family protein [Fodinibius salsisoli]MCW9709123.1 polysaccharide deacetylase family protein [Fodinibius salsisoli]
MKHALSFDIEDWFHIAGLPQLERRGNWEQYPSIVEDKTNLILDILDRYGVKATFFVLGWVAQKYPSLVRDIAARGHEIGTHGYWHYRVNTLSPDQFHDYLKQSVEVLEDLIGSKIKGYRAPSFSITQGNEWAFEVMSEMGIEYDASLFPAQRGHGGYDIEQGPQILSKEYFDTRFAELPMSMISFGSMNIPFSGGGYLRFWPKSVIKYGFNQLEKREIPGVVYLHPRDFAPDCPRVRMPLNRRFKCYIGLSTTKGKLNMLLQNFTFGTCQEVLNDWNVLNRVNGDRPSK